MAITNITELRNDLLDTYDKLKNGKMPIEQAKELSNASGKIINSLKVQLSYAEQRKEKPEIEFIK